MPSHEDRRAEWRLLLDQYATSGLTAAAWCRERNVTPRAFSYWKNALNTASAKESPSKKWLKVEAGSAKETSCEIQSLTVRIGSASVEVSPGFDGTLLYDVVKALGGLE